MTDEKTSNSNRQLGHGRHDLVAHSSGLVTAGRRDPVARQSPILRFPPDRSIGTLYARDRGSQLTAAWEEIGEARGTITVPPGKELKLSLNWKDLAHLSRLTPLVPDHLLALDVGGIGCGDDALEHVQQLTGLRHLIIRGHQITGAGLVHLRPLAALECLDLTNTQVSDDGLAYLHGLLALKRLWLRGTRVTDIGLAHLRRFPALQGLFLQGTLITDAGLAYFRELAELESLDLAGTDITDVGLANLRELTGLKRLSLSGTDVTDAGLTHLMRLSALEWLDFTYTQVTDPGMANLRTRLPTLSDGLQETETLRESRCRENASSLVDVTEAVRDRLEVEGTCIHCQSRGRAYPRWERAIAPRLILCCANCPTGFVDIWEWSASAFGDPACITLEGAGSIYRFMPFEGETEWIPEGELARILLRKRTPNDRGSGILHRGAETNMREDYYPPEVGTDEVIEQRKPYGYCFFGRVFDPRRYRDGLHELAEKTVIRFLRERCLRPYPVPEDVEGEELWSKIAFGIRTTLFGIYEISAKGAENVYQELGYAVGLGKPVYVLLNKKVIDNYRDLPKADIAGHCRIDYENEEDLLEGLRRIPHYRTSPILRLQNKMEQAGVEWRRALALLRLREEKGLEMHELISQLSQRLPEEWSNQKAAKFVRELDEFLDVTQRDDFEKQLIRLRRVFYEVHDRLNGPTLVDEKSYSGQ